MFRERWHFVGLFIRKIHSISRAIVFFVCDKKMNKIERSIFGVFYFFIIEKVRIAFRQEKKLHKVYRKCQNWFSKFRSNNYDVKNALHSGRNRSWRRRSKGVDRSKLTDSRENVARLNLLNSTVYDRTWNDLVFRCREKKTRLLSEQPIQMRLIAKIFKWKSDIFSIQRE